MATPSPQIEDLKYLYASNANVSNFVSIKLSSNNNYHLWKEQMLCLMETHNMRGLVDDAFVDQSALSEKIKEQYNSLLKGWIFGSICEGVLGIVVVHKSARQVWKNLERIYVPSKSSSEDSAQTKAEAKEGTKDKGIPTETKTEDKDEVLVTVGRDIEADGEYCTIPTEDEKRIVQRMLLCRATMIGHWPIVEFLLRKGKDAEREELNGDNNTVLHLAVGIGHEALVKNLVQYIIKKEESAKDKCLKEESPKDKCPKEESSKDKRPSVSALELKNKHGSTALHVAAIVGNRYAAELLVERNNNLLTISDKDEKLPLYRAYSNRQFDTFMYLWEAVQHDEKAKKIISEDHDHKETGVNLLVDAISAKSYGTASDLIKAFPELAVENDEVLMAIARTFPSGLNYWETLIYPCPLSDFHARMYTRLFILRDLCNVFITCKCFDKKRTLMTILDVVGILLSIGYSLLCLLILTVYYPFFMVYSLWWKVATRLVPPIKHIRERKKEWVAAIKVLDMVCDRIDNANAPRLYKRPILEAACQNAYQVVDEILYRSPEAIQSTDENGYDIIQLGIIHRSEKIYNLIYQLGELKNRYRTSLDSSKNNILHLVGRLAPSHELNCRTGAALRLQRELQWREELEKFVFPAYITQENIFKETPAMVFSREHKDLVKEGEKWIKATAESCSITAALITTIVFAAAITVPGGNNQETGIPLFRNDIAFIIFAASDAISLFTSSTALLVFLSVLTARFAEQDFLISLPRRLIIGFGALLLSTTAMMISFSAILYLVFCDKKSWMMIGLICGLAFIPIASFVALQFSLIVDLHRSTYGRIFGKQANWHPSRFNSCDVQGYIK